MTTPGHSLDEYVRIGDLLADRYQIEATVGHGAFGGIYSAIDRHTGERVAVKAIPPAGQAASDTAVARFHREMRVISKLVHRHIVGLYDFGETDQNVLFMILEYVDGRPLDRVVRGHPLGVKAAASICEQIGSALSLAHHTGVIHRDLKPANVMLVDRDGGYEVKVLDFGMAKLLSSGADTSIAQLTREGMAVGTPRYIAPEQARGQQVGPWSDLYALGLLMYEMLTGARAVKADDVDGAVSAHVDPDPLELAEIGQVPDSFRPVLLGLLEKDPQQRYRSAQAFLSDLDGLRHDAVLAAGQPGGLQFAPRRARLEADGQATDQGVDRCSTSGASRQRRQQARQMIEDGHDDASAELDWGRYKQHAPGHRDPARPAEHQPSSALDGLRRPRRTREWIEATAAPAVGLVGFIVVTAQLRTLSYGLRLTVGLMPLITALFMSASSARTSWRSSFVRLWNLWSVAAFLVGHALGPRALTHALYRHGLWFMEPVEQVVGMEAARSVLTWGMRWYAVSLSTMIDAAAAVIH